MHKEFGDGEISSHSHDLCSSKGTHFKRPSGKILEIKLTWEEASAPWKSGSALVLTFTSEVLRRQHPSKNPHSDRYLGAWAFLPCQQA